MNKLSIIFSLHFDVLLMCYVVVDFALFGGECDNHGKVCVSSSTITRYRLAKKCWPAGDERNLSSSSLRCVSVLKYHPRFIMSFVCCSYIFACVCCLVVWCIQVRTSDWLFIEITHVSKFNSASQTIEDQ